MVRCDRKSSAGRVTGGDPPEIIYLICQCAGGVRCRPSRGTHAEWQRGRNLEEHRSRSRHKGVSGLDRTGHRCNAMQGRKGQEGGHGRYLDASTA